MKPRITHRILNFGFTAAAMIIATAFLAGYARRGSTLAAANAVSQQNDIRTRVATGEYEVTAGQEEEAIGPYLPGVYDFRESWTLWRLPDGDFEAEGKRNYESPLGEDHSNPFSVLLAKDLTVRNMTEFRKLRWRPDSGPLSCEFKPAELDCSSGAKDPANAINVNMPMKAAYGLLWPISAFSLSNLTRHATRIPGKITPVQLVTAEEQDRLTPVFVSVLDGHLKYLGKEEIKTAGQNWRADKFELKVPLRLPFLIWTSSQGLLLRFSPEVMEKSSPATGMFLVHYTTWTTF